MNNNNNSASASSFDDAVVENEDSASAVVNDNHNAAGSRNSNNPPSPSDASSPTSSQVFLSNPNLDDGDQEADYQNRQTGRPVSPPTWVQNARNAPPVPPAVSTVAGVTVAANNNAATADDGFVFVTRPLPSIRLKDPWASGENLPGVSPQNNTTSRTTLPVTQIRRNLISTSPSGATASSQAGDDPMMVSQAAGVPGSNGLFEVEVFSEGDDGERTVITPGAGFLNLYDPQTNEFILVIEQKSFYHDVLASFSSAEEIKSAQEERYRLREIQENANKQRDNSNSSARGWFSWRSIPERPAPRSHPANTNNASEAMLTAPRTYESMLRAQNPPVFTTDAANNSNSSTTAIDLNSEAVPTLSQLQWEKVWKQFKCDVGRENFCIGGKRIIDPDQSLLELNTLFETFALDLRDYAKKQEMEAAERQKRQQRNGTAVGTPSLAAAAIGNSLWYAMAFPIELATWSARLFASGVVTAPLPVTSTTTAPVSATSTDGSATPSSTLSHEAATANENATALAGALSRMVILLSQQSVLALPYELFVRQFVDSDQLGGASIYVGETKHEERKGDEPARGGMKVNVHRSQAYETFCNERTAPQQLSTPDAGHIGQSNDAAGGRVTTTPGTPPLTPSSRPSIYITIEKEFRVFSIPNDDVEDRTLFHISSQISFCITDGGDVVQLKWILSPPPPPTTPPASMSPLVANGNDAALHSQRVCDCLGATSGFHRSTCFMHRTRAME